MESFVLRSLKLANQSQNTFTKALSKNQMTIIADKLDMISIQAAAFGGVLEDIQIYSITLGVFILALGRLFFFAFVIYEILLK